MCVALLASLWGPHSKLILPTFCLRNEGISRRWWGADRFKANALEMSPVVVLLVKEQCFSNHKLNPKEPYSPRLGYNYCFWNHLWSWALPKNVLVVFNCSTDPGGLDPLPLWKEWREGEGSVVIIGTFSIWVCVKTHSALTQSLSVSDQAPPKQREPVGKGV